MYSNGNPCDFIQACIARLPASEGVVSLFDDQFEVVLFEGRSTFPYVKYFGALALNQLEGVAGVTVLRARGARLSAAEDTRIYVQVDGEFAGRLPAEIRMVPDALTMLVPPEYVRAHQ